MCQWRHLQSIDKCSRVNKEWRRALKLHLGLVQDLIPDTGSCCSQSWPCYLVQQPLSESLSGKGASGVWRQCLNDPCFGVILSARVAGVGIGQLLCPWVCLWGGQQPLEAADLLNPAKREGCGSPSAAGSASPVHLSTLERVCVPESSLGQGDSRSPDLVCWGL